MSRTLIGSIIGVAVVAAIVLATMTQFSTKCEVCIDYRGRRICETALAASRERAEMEATSSACTQLTGGVTQLMECTRIRPARVSCTE